MDFVEQLKSSVDIVHVIQEYVRLRKAGPTRFSGLCPFHNEKTPSFSVHAGHQFYKCFGCGAAGDVLKFVMEMERISFYEALKLLAERHGRPVIVTFQGVEDGQTLRGDVAITLITTGDVGPISYTLAGAPGPGRRHQCISIHAVSLLVCLPYPN